MNKIVLPQLSYRLMGILFKVHRELGPVHKEKNYQDTIEVLLKKNNIAHEREKEIFLVVNGEKVSGFFLDFLIENNLILEIKAKNSIKHEDIRQILRYLQSTHLPLAIIVNFKRQKLEHKRIINPEVADNYKEAEKSDSVPFGSFGYNSGNIHQAKGKILGIDYGQKRMGLALSDDDQKFAFVYNTFESKSNVQLAKNKVINDIRNICKLEDVESIVVGMPTNLSGQNNKITEEVFEFIRKLEESLNIPIDTQDERLTTVEAQKIKDKSSRNLDELSAQIILQTYLDKINI